MWKTEDDIKIQRLLTTNSPMKVSQNDSVILVDTGRKKAEQATLKNLKSLMLMKNFS